MKRKKLVSLCLAASMTAGMLAGCGAGETKETAGTKGESTAAATESGEKTELTFFYPIGVGGALATLIENLSTEFTKENPDIVINPVFAGNSTETMTKTA